MECRRIMLAEPLRELPGADRLVASISAHAETVLGVAVESTGVPLYTDARHYSAAGIPTVLYGAGPRSILEANAHAADEHVQLSDLKAATPADRLSPSELRKTSPAVKRVIPANI